MNDLKIPLQEILAQCDTLFNAGKSAEKGELLRFWRQKAREAGDRQGELSLLNELMGHYRMTGDVSRGLEAVREGTALIELLQIGGSLSAGTIFLNGATALHAFGETDKALELYERSYQNYTRHLSCGDERFAGLFNNMASVYIDKGLFKQAEDLYLKALDLLNESRNPLDAAVTCLNLAQLYRKMGDEALTDTMASCARDYFDAPGVERGSYYAHTCRKCASGFGALGCAEMEAELNERADRYYAGT